MFLSQHFVIALKVTMIPASSYSPRCSTSDNQLLLQQVIAQECEMLSGASRLLHLPWTGVSHYKHLGSELKDTNSAFT